LNEIDNGRPFGKGFKATWTLARHNENMLDLVEPESDCDAEDYDSGGELDEAPY